jgi:hypothetical protein
MLMVVARLDGRRITHLERQWAGRAPSPAQSEFLDLVNDLWYHAVWTAKELRRGEMWTANHGAPERQGL